MGNLLVNLMRVGHANERLMEPQPLSCVIRRGTIQLEEAITQGCILVYPLERTNVNCKRILALVGQDFDGFSI